MLLLHDSPWVVASADRHLRDAAVCVEEERILDVGPTEELKQRYPGAERIDCSGIVLVPGFVNPHNHVYEILGRGLAKDKGTEAWLRDLVYPVNAALSDEDFYYGALLACADAFRNGITTTVEQVTNLARFHADAEFRAFLDCGMRARVARASSTASTIDPRENGTPDEEVEATASFLSRWEGETLVRPWVGPSGLFSCDGDTLRRLKELADAHGTMFTIHLSETRQQLALAQERGYVGQVDWAHRVGILDASTVVAHVTWINDAEVEILRATGTHAVHNPSSNMILASGIANVKAMLRAGVNVAVATDGLASNDAQDVLAEMKLATLLQRVNTLDPGVLDAKTCWRMGTEAGAAMIGHAGELGRIEPGGLADLAGIRVGGNPCLAPLYDPVEALVYHGSGRDVCLTVVNGNVVYRDGVHATIDVEDVLRRIAETTMPKVRAAVGLEEPATTPQALAGGFEI